VTESQPLPTLPALPTLGPVTRRVPPAGARRAWQTAEVVQVRDETAQARTLRLRLPPGSETHVPGQHYVVRTPRDDGSWAQRSYSAASAPDRGEPADGPHVELTVERLADGELSPMLHALTVGASVSLRGPFGGWFLWRGDTPALLVGGGSGVVPLMAMYRYRREGSTAAPLHLVVSVRTPADLFYRDELLADGAGVTVVHTRVAPDGDPRPPGRLDAATLEPLLRPGATCFVCGSTGFAEHASRLLVDLGVPATDVRVERFGPS
jgi:ferredoxin-NADP reductase